MCHEWQIFFKIAHKDFSWSNLPRITSTRGKFTSVRRALVELRLLFLFFLCWFFFLRLAFVLVCFARFVLFSFVLCQFVVLTLLSSNCCSRFLLLSTSPVCWTQLLLSFCFWVSIPQINVRLSFLGSVSYAHTTYFCAEFIKLKLLCSFSFVVFLCSVCELWWLFLFCICLLFLAHLHVRLSSFGLDLLCSNWCCDQFV